MKLRSLIKICFVLLLLGTIFKVQYPEIFHIKTAISTIVATNNPAPDPIGPDNPFAGNNFFSRDLLRLEILLLFLFLLSFFAYFYSIFKFPSIKVWLPEVAIPHLSLPVKLNNKAPPLF